jgi:hypothetical protein
MYDILLWSFIALVALIVAEPGTRVAGRRN